MAEEGTTLLEQPPIHTIDTERLHLKTITMDDLDNIMDIITDVSIKQWTSQGPVANRQQGERWLSARALGPGVINFAIRERLDDQVKGKIIGIIGSFHPPACGYMIHSGHTGNGYATEALKAFVPFYFQHHPSVSGDGLGFDHIEGFVDAQNYASQRILEKCGFTKVVYREQAFNSPLTGLRDDMIFRYPRPGTTLEQLGLDAASEARPSGDQPPEPPVQ
ncbi:hypothetical protein CLAFUW4_09125 [Fulvia fulva]|uniref:N-acetyltransferase domain-containing protein n=1 Tax=Passalora fulva TaxID=5499 RepID=A0A9Q8PGX9_PASFU|nr:uncharacterized protein CLAFUR5_09236 [Fulvia fulva]KAK4613658.1 hypothetical protein CLAFUR4_09131 [Fulvia fulva]KAK4614890.1 hypothetical protein CLAFUR0_09123 [Fulvia fulva]UJO22187.1 hypothetical protein CLAFUR5_09236 [Fulvia fulva]WPV20395.1 hypothetical protein CLAFUW4_09125 [Fulvia fulva]WPV35309.1 hypothetical protein CLAFUW7_09126 [Fulvia fulva]